MYTYIYWKEDVEQGWGEQSTEAQVSNGVWKSGCISTQLLFIDSILLVYIEAFANFICMHSSIMWNFILISFVRRGKVAKKHHSNLEKYYKLTLFLLSISLLLLWWQNFIFIHFISLILQNLEVFTRRKMNYIQLGI